MIQIRDVQSGCLYSFEYWMKFYPVLLFYYSKIGGKPFVAGSVGPYGACLCDGSEYNGNYLKPGHPDAKLLGADKAAIREFLRNWHRDRIKVHK